MPRYDALLIDFYGTISAGDREAVERACVRIVTELGVGMTAPQFAVAWGERFFDHIERCNGADFRTLYECEILSLRETLAPYDGRGDLDPFVAELEAYWADPPVHDDAFEFLQGVDIPICCVSNADTAPLMSAIQKHGLVFDAIVTSEQARSYKPDVSIFRQAVNRLGLDPSRVMHVGDSLHSDIGGASKLGITTVWIQRDDRIHDIGTAEPHHTISRLTELHDLLA